MQPVVEENQTDEPKEPTVSNEAPNPAGSSSQINDQEAKEKY